MPEILQQAGTVVGYQASSDGHFETWPIIDNYEGGVIIDLKLMEEGREYDAEIGGDRYLFVRCGQSVDCYVYEDA